MAQQQCVDCRVSVSHGRRPIDLPAPNKGAEAFPESETFAQQKATVLCDHTLYMCMLLVSIIPIGCGQQSKDRFSLPEHPTPLPDSSDHIDMGTVHPESGQLLERSD